MKTSQDLDRMLTEVIPVLVHRFMIGGGAVKVCGAISDAFGSIAKSRGFEVVVADRPNHFVNEISTKDGTYEVDLSAIQFECRGQKDVPKTLLRLTEDPYRAIRIRKLDRPIEGRQPAPENPDFFWTPAESYPQWRELALQAGRGEYSQDAPWEISATGGKPFGYGVSWMSVASLGLLGALAFWLRRFAVEGHESFGA